ncbi:hypothetical protein niasHS_001602 [Heterodera schachtii]|uniref:RNA helicase n=1 Tax=Heterodera schachtii TaxID=97005 RepID=A0ABD2KE96_HETSC
MRWSEFEFEPALLTNIQKANYTVPRKIQSLTFPLIKAGHDLKGHAETGSGKSAAFLLPIIDAVMKLKKGGHYKSRRCCPFALIVEPTRELTVQVYDQARKLAEECDVSVSRAYGMFLRHVNLRQISTDGCDILVGTPGRLCDFFQSKNLLCDQIKVLVFDEADQLLEDGFQAVLRQLNNVNNWPQPENRQTLLFSATFPLVVQNWADEWMRKDSMMVSNKRLVAANSRIKQKFLMVPNTAKKDVLLRLFQLELQTAKKRDPVNGKIRNTMVFVNTKRDADVVSTYLNQFDFNTTTINGNRPQEMREKALSDFRAGVYQIVVTTDVCARGHDLKDLDHVINMDLPASGEGIDDSFTTYVHRIGRTGRLQPGSATTFFDIQADGTMAEGFVQSLQEATQPVPDWLNKLVAREPIAGSGQVTDEELLGIL